MADPPLPTPDSNPAPLHSTAPSGMRGKPRQRPGNIPGSTTGSPVDPGRNGITGLGDAEGKLPPHTTG